MRKLVPLEIAYRLINPGPRISPWPKKSSSDLGNKIFSIPDKKCV